MDGVIDKINSKKAMKNFKAYPVVIAKTIENESNGEIKLDTSKLKISKKEANEALIKYGLKTRKQVKTEAQQERTSGHKHLSLVA